MEGKISLRGQLWRLDQSGTGDLDLENFDQSPALLRCLANRGITTAEEINRALTPSWDHLHSPHLMAGVAEGVARVRRAAAGSEHVRVVTDYDVDGTTSSLILQATLKLLGLKISYHIPNRKGEGYGFSVIAAEKAAEDGVNLIITADIGVKDHAAVSRARELGVDVIICDHHLPPGDDVPSDAIVLCPPQAACDYPNPHLAACGVSLKFAEALLSEHPKREAILRSMSKLAAIGTVADVVDLMNSENRAIVSLGLQQLNQPGGSPGLQALLEVSGVTQGAVTSSDLGYRIGPRINAAGRLTCATLVVELLNCRDPGKAREMAGELDEVNRERRKIQDDLLDEITASIVEPAPAAIVVWGEEESGWHRGVTGIVAGRLRDRFHRPALTLSANGDELVGSMRSTPELHAVELLESVSHLLIRYGGHPAAAGFSVRRENLEEFQRAVVAAAEEAQGGEPPTPEVTADLKVSPHEIGLHLADELAVLEPHGKGNPRPVIWIEPTAILSHRLLKERHIKLRLEGCDADVLWWNSAEHLDDILACDRIEVLGTLEINEWGGRRKPQLILRDARPC